MERALDFMLDSASRNELRSPSGSTGNGLAPALRVNTLPTPSAFGWRTLRVPHTTRWRLEQQHELICQLSPAASQRLASLLRIDYPLLVVQEIGARLSKTKLEAAEMLQSIYQERANTGRDGAGWVVPFVITEARLQEVADLIEQLSKSPVKKKKK